MYAKYYISQICGVRCDEYYIHQIGYTWILIHIKYILNIHISNLMYIKYETLYMWGMLDIYLIWYTLKYIGFPPSNPITNFIVLFVYLLKIIWFT